jgi:UDP-N-acetylglucosamine 2-epimerase (non-hydrolysing)
MTHVACVFGTRPEAIKMAPVIAELRARVGVTCTVCVSAQHRELLDDVLDVFDITPDHDLDIMVEDQTMSGVTAGVLQWLEPLLGAVEPDWVLVQGDTTTTMAAALASFHAGVPIAHLEAGLRSRNLRAPFPEELNRRLVTLTAGLHLAATDRAAQNLRAEGIAPANIVVTGNTVVDAFLDVTSRPFERAGTPLEGVRMHDRRIVLLTAHRREIFGGRLADALRAVRALAERYPGDIEVVYPVHPNPSVRGTAHELLGDLPNVRLTAPLSYPALAHLLAGSTLVLTDSGGLQEEAPSAGVPVLVLRDETERVEAIEAGTARLVGTQTDRIFTEACHLLDDPSARRAMVGAGNPYGDGQARVRVVDALRDRS